jgi:hypothetical protein
MASAWATLIVYAFQMVVSYKLGQKYYPIKYNLRKFVLYLGFALLLFCIAAFLDLQAQTTMKFIVHNLFVSSYILLVFLLEKSSFKKV